MDDTNPKKQAIAACIEKVKRWQHDNKQFGIETPRPHPVLEALSEAAQKGEFPIGHAGSLAQDLARNEYKISQAEALVFAERANLVVNLPNVQRFTAAIKAQNAIFSEIHVQFPL